MIELYYWPTPNGLKVKLFLEEAQLPYRVRLINLGQGEQLAASFRAISPNGRIPAIVDREPADGGFRCRCSSRARFCGISRRSRGASYPRARASGW